MVRCALLAALILVFPALLGGCSGPKRPWKVPPERERRFLQAQEACRQLTDDDAGFEKCMERRGFRREYPGGL